MSRQRSTTLCVEGSLDLSYSFRAMRVRTPSVRAYWYASRRHPQMILQVRARMLFHSISRRCRWCSDGANECEISSSDYCVSIGMNRFCIAVYAPGLSVLSLVLRCRCSTDAAVVWSRGVPRHRSIFPPMRLRTNSRNARLVCSWPSLWCAGRSSRPWISRRPARSCARHMAQAFYNIN